MHRHQHDAVPASVPTGARPSHRPVETRPAQAKHLADRAASGWLPFWMFDC
ncbi:hypothetical protein FHX73_114696 [Kitasatospora viridis]|uniref:Uncharacterized protein n=1 Tax=Kitasatospora viridis TaxID=281105 RepID=A0A561UN68_9ACTN|nr:hypothetical protein FHX73_114696 [Kitasatospora viridis]